MTDADKSAFLSVFARLALALGGAKEPDRELLRVYFDTLTDIAIEFLAMAATELAKSSQWFPKTSEWRAAAAKIESDRREKQRRLLAKLPEPLCLACSDTGWAVDSTPGWTAGGKIASTLAHPCDCADLRRLELLGRRPWPEPPALLDVPDDAISHAETLKQITRIERKTGLRIAPRSMPKPSYVVRDDEEGNGKCE